MEQSPDGFITTPRDWVLGANDQMQLSDAEQARIEADVRKHRQEKGLPPEPPDGEWESPEEAARLVSEREKRMRRSPFVRQS